MYNKKVFKNQVRLITLPLHETKTASLLVLFKVGSRFEEERMAGISHFVEHMMFKGTKRRPKTLDLSKELDRIGAEYNAFTGKDYTGYYVKSDGKHLSLAIDVLSDMLLHSKFDPEEVEREKRVIIEEINMYEDNPMMLVEDILEQIMFQDNPLGRSIAGTRESVKGISADDLISYRDNNYRGVNVVIGLGGRFGEGHLKEIEEKFSFLGSENKNKFERIAIDQKEPRIKLMYKETEQVQLAMGFPAFSYGDERIYPLQILSAILGGNMSSRLFLQVREKHGLAYFIRSWVNIFDDTGGLVIQSGLDKNRIEEAIEIIIEELKKIKEGVTEEELSRAKDSLSGRMAIDLEDSLHLSQWFVQQELFLDELMTPEEKLEKFNKVTLEEVKKIAEEVINFNKLSLAVIGPFKDESKFKNILNS